MTADIGTGWSLFIIVLIIINIGGCAWLIWWTMNMHTEEQSEGDLSTGHVWDVDLKENNNPLPKWWLNTFYLTIIFTIVYLILYPGFGNFAGVLGWSQYGQYDQEVAASEAKLESVYAAFDGLSIEELSSNPDALAIGANTYQNFCAQCHGSDARGARGYPNLTDDAWMWGGSAEAVYQTVANGRMGVMAPLGLVVGDEGAERIIDYLLADEGDTSENVAAGRQKYLTSGCIGCHGMNGEGNPLLGAPNLRDGVWLHGSDRESIKNIIMNGINNQMPAQLDVIGEDRARMVSAYVLSLSQ